MPAPLGFWEEGPDNSRVVAVHACLLYTGKVLFFHCRSYNNMEQRYVELNYVSSDGEPYHVATAPSDAYKAPPGYYMLFVLKHTSESISGYSRIPSNAKIVKLY